MGKQSRLQSDDFDERLVPRGPLSDALLRALQAEVDIRTPLVGEPIEFIAEVLRVRRIGKWLLFATVKAGERLLQLCGDLLSEHVEEVQVVAGRRLFETIGNEHMGVLIKQMKKGCVVRARGWPHRNPRQGTIDFKVSFLQ